MNRILRSALLLCLPLAPLAHGAAEAPTDQVTVEATRTNLTKLAKRISEVQVRFYKRYNELNTVRDYAINCYSEAPPNSHLNKQYCQPVFQTKAEAEESRSFFLGLVASYSEAK